MFAEATIVVHGEACGDKEGWREAVEECRSALAMSNDERCKLVVDIPSEEEEEEEGEELSEGGERCNGVGVTPSGRKRARPLSSAGEEDSEGEIGVRKVGRGPSGVLVGRGASVNKLSLLTNESITKGSNHVYIYILYGWKYWQE